MHPQRLHEIWPARLVLGTTGQTLTIRHDLIDRDGFMPGVVVAVLGVDGTGCTVGLDALLGP